MEAGAEGRLGGLPRGQHSSQQCFPGSLLIFRGTRVSRLLYLCSRWFFILVNRKAVLITESSKLWIKVKITLWQYSPKGQTCCPHLVSGGQPGVLTSTVPAHTLSSSKE